jgi:hypothetical protein
MSGIRIVHWIACEHIFKIVGTDTRPGGCGSTSKSLLSERRIKLMDCIVGIKLWNQCYTLQQTTTLRFRYRSSLSYSRQCCFQDILRNDICYVGLHAILGRIIMSTNTRSPFQANMFPLGASMYNSSERCPKLVASHARAIS